MNYQIEIKQLVQFPYCRLYRSFINSISENTDIRKRSGSLLFYFVVLFSLANYRRSRRSLEGLRFSVAPGEWVARYSELCEKMGIRYQYHMLEMLHRLEEMHLIEYKIYPQQKIVRFKICCWKETNTSLDYSAPCCKNLGFIFLPVDLADKLIAAGRCSEADMLFCWDFDMLRIRNFRRGLEWLDLAGIAFAFDFQKPVLEQYFGELVTVRVISLANAERWLFHESNKVLRSAAVAVLAAAFLYCSGLLAQLFYNREVWLRSGGGIPELPSLAPMAIVQALFRWPYGPAVILTFLFLLAGLWFYFFRMGRDDASAFDEARNLEYSDKGIYGTAGFMNEEELAQVLERKSAADPRS